MSHYVAVPITVRERYTSLPGEEPEYDGLGVQDKTGVREHQEYLKVPVWLIILLVGILISLLGTIATVTYSVATLRADVTEMQRAVSSQSSTSLQSQIDHLSQKEDLDYKTNEERINAFRLEEAKRRGR